MPRPDVPPMVPEPEDEQDELDELLHGRARGGLGKEKEKAKGMGRRKGNGHKSVWRGLVKSGLAPKGEEGILWLVLSRRKGAEAEDEKTIDTNRERRWKRRATGTKWTHRADI